MERTVWQTGRWGEDAAADYLVARGWTVEARNYRAGPNEIDLVVSRGSTVAFVEVKTRRTRSGGTPLEAIGRAKMRAVASAARRWILERGRAGSTYRFDAISVQAFGARMQIEHVPDAWRLG